MAIKSKARHDLTLRSIKREIVAGRDVAYWLAEVEALAQAYYDALDAEDSKTDEPTEDAETVS